MSQPPSPSKKAETSCYRDGRCLTYEEMIKTLREKSSSRYVTTDHRKFAAAMIENLCAEIDILQFRLQQKERELS